MTGNQHRFPPSGSAHASVYSPLYLDYLSNEVGYVVRHGAMPTDLSAGFSRMRARFLSGDRGRLFVEAVRTSVTDPYDTHPSLDERLRALEGLPNGPDTRDPRPASVLFADPEALDAWLVQATRERVIAAVLANDGKVGVLRELPWEKIPAEVHAPAAKEAARKVAALLHPRFPGATTFGAMFAALWRHLGSGNMLGVAAHLEPSLGGLPPGEAERAAFDVCSMALGTLMQGALLDRGATVEDSLGSASLVFRLGEERIDALETLRFFAKNPDEGRTALNGWAARFEREAQA